LILNILMTILVSLHSSLLLCKNFASADLPFRNIRLNGLSCWAGDSGMFGHADCVSVRSTAVGCSTGLLSAVFHFHLRNAQVILDITIVAAIAVLGAATSLLLSRYISPVLYVD